MDQLSRRDAVYQQLGQLRDAVMPAESGSGSASERNRAGAVPASLNLSQANQNVNRYIDRVTTGVQGLLQAGPTSSSLGRSPSSMYASCGKVASTNSSFENLGASGGESLPDYAPAQASQPVKFTHSIKSSTGKLEILLDSVGSKQHPVYVQGICPEISGKLLLRLQGDENVNELRLRIKGVVTTSVMRSHQSAHRTIADETEFWYESLLLWSSSSKGTTMDASQGIHQFPFRLKIPPSVPTSPRIPKSYPMPPSFVTQSPFAFELGAVAHASIRYYIKVTLAKKGLLRPNERLFAPLVYLTRETDLSFINASRRRALTHATPLPNPQEAPENWQGLTGDKTIRKGLFGGKKVNYKIAVLLPAPHIYGKIESLPYYIRLSSSDPTQINKLDASSISVGLVQRCQATSQGFPGLQEIFVDKGITHLVDDTSGSIQDTNARRFTGTISLGKAPAVTFHSLNLDISYHIVCHLMQNGRAQEMMASIPIRLVSIPPVASAAQTSALPADNTASVMSNQDVPDLPPSYFDVVESPGPLRSEKS